MLALVLGESGDAATAAAALLERFGSPAGIAAADHAELTAVPGIGPARAHRLAAALELGARAAVVEDPEGLLVRGPDDLAPVLREEFRGRDRERFLALHLDTRHRLRAVETVSVGSLGASLVHPREVFRTAVRRGTAALVVAHNHPSGCAEPSREDLELTVRLAECGRLMGIEVLDHLIVGAGAVTSLRERGWPHPEPGEAAAAVAQQGRSPCSRV